VWVGCAGLGVYVLGLSSSAVIWDGLFNGA